MADVATPPAAQTAAANGSAPQGKQQVVKPEKPDEDKYKEDLAKAEKEHTAAQEKLVSSRSNCWSHAHSCTVAPLHACRPADGWLRRMRTGGSGELC